MNILTFSDQILALSKSCYYHISQLHCIRPYLDATTACTIATSIVHFKLTTVILFTAASLYILLPGWHAECRWWYWWSCGGQST